MDRPHHPRADLPFLLGKEARKGVGSPMNRETFGFEARIEGETSSSKRRTRVVGRTDVDIAPPSRRFDRNEMLRTMAMAGRGEAVAIPNRFTTLKPEGGRILVKPQEAASTTRGGLLLPSEAAPRPTCGSVVSVGGEARAVKDGQAVLYSKFGLGCLDVEVQGEAYLLMREQDVMGTLPTVEDAEDASKIEPTFDRVLVKVDPVSETSAGGLVLPESAKEKPSMGTVVRAGPGKEDEEGEFKPTNVKEGDRVMYFKYAGEMLAGADGEDYVVVKERDVLCKF